MRLVEFPAGQPIFLDANCLVYHFTGAYPSCAHLLDRLVHLTSNDGDFARVPGLTRWRP